MQDNASGWAQIVAYCGFVEFSGGFEDYKSGTPGELVAISKVPASAEKKALNDLDSDFVEFGVYKTGTPDCTRKKIPTA